MTLAPAAPRPLPRRPVETARCSVTAVLVAADGAQFLPRTLAAIAAQTRQPDLVLAVDAGSGDDTPLLLAGATPHVSTLPRTATFGDAVHAALAGPRDLVAPPPAGTADRPADRVEWLWLLHDDAAPAPDALAALLAEIETAPSVGIAGCKQVQWDDDQRLLDVGVTTSLLGARITGLDRGEVDQGQHDDRRDVLAVGTAGMLVRRDVWDELGGFDPGLARARADLDLCRRARLAGSRVVVVPGAVVAHADARRTGRRPGAPDWYGQERREALHARLATVPAGLLPVAVAWSLVAAPVRAAAWLALKRPDRSVADLVAVLAVLLHPLAIWRSRRRQARARRVPRRTLRRLGATPRQLWRQRRDECAAWIVPRGRDGTPAPARGRVLAPLSVLAITTAAATVALWPTLRGGRTGGVPVGPFLLPAPPGVAELWDAATSGWRPVGLGRAGEADPFTALLALLSLPLGGSPQRAVTLLLLAGLPLAALAAWTAARVLTRSRLLRAWAALAWAAAPPLTAAVASGRPGAVLAHVLLPLVAVAVARAVRGPSGSLAAAAAAGLGLTVLLAAAPSLALPALAVLVALAVRARRRALPLLGALLVPAALLLPWWTAVAEAPRLLLADPSVADAAAGTPAPTAWGLLSPGGFPSPAGDWAALPGRPDGVPGALVLLGLAVLACTVLAAGLVGPARRGRAGRVAALAWGAAFAGAAVAVQAGRTVLATGAGTGAAGAAGADLGGGAGVVRGWPGPGLSLLWFGAGVSALVAVPAIVRSLRSHTPATLRAIPAGRLPAPAARVLSRALPTIPVLAVALTVAGPGALLAGWARDGGIAVRRADPDVLPAVAAAEAEGRAGIRTLVLDASGGGGTVRWSLARSGGPRLGEGSSALALAAIGGSGDDRRLRPVVAGLLAGGGRDLRPRLADLAVGSVYLLPPVDEAVAAAVDASPGLLRVTTARRGVLWRVQPAPEDGVPGRPARARILSPDGTSTVATLASGPAGSARTRVVDVVRRGPSGRLVVLAERADAGWQAWLDGARLPATTHAGWAQAFVLPARGGRLVVEHAGPLPPALDAGRAAVAALALVLALPLPRVRRRVAPPPPPRPSRPVPRAPEPAGVVLPAPRVFGDDHPEEGRVPPVLHEPPTRRGWVGWLLRHGTGRRRATSRRRGGRR